MKNYYGSLRSSGANSRSRPITASSDTTTESKSLDPTSEGDLIVAPRNLDVEPVDTTIDALDCIEEPYVLLDDEHEVVDHCLGRCGTRR